MQDVRQAADVDVIEVRASRLPQGHEGGKMRDDVAAFGGASERGPIANVAVHEAPGKAAAGRRSGEHHHVVSGGRERVHDGLSKVPAAAGHEDAHAQY